MTTVRHIPNSPHRRDHGDLLTGLFTINCRCFILYAYWPIGRIIKEYAPETPPAYRDSVAMLNAKARSNMHERGSRT